jgi:hypothetical protein
MFNAGHTKLETINLDGDVIWKFYISWVLQKFLYYNNLIRFVVRYMGMKYAMGL